MAYFLGRDVKVAITTEDAAGSFSNTSGIAAIANAATPNFKARDIDFGAELKKANNVGQLDVTNSNHIKTFSSRIGDKTLYRDPINPSLDGNTVELSVEQMEFSENVMKYQTTLTFLNNKISGLMSAIRGE